MSCEYYNACGFIDIMRKSDPCTERTVKAMYCHGNKAACMRYCLLQVLGDDFVPDYLWPNDDEGAEYLIKETIHAESMSDRMDSFSIAG